MKAHRVKNHVERTIARPLTDEEDGEMCAAGMRQFLNGAGSRKIGKAMQKAALAAATRSNIQTDTRPKPRLG
jgi:hypothetical protein